MTHSSEFTPKSQYLQAASDEERRAEFAHPKPAIHRPGAIQLRQEEQKELEESILQLMYACQHPMKLAEIRQQLPSARWALFNDAKDALNSKGLIVAASLSRRNSTYQLTPKGAAYIGGSNDLS